MLTRTEIITKILRDFEIEYESIGECEQNRQEVYIKLNKDCDICNRNRVIWCTVPGLEGLDEPDGTYSVSIFYRHGFGFLSALQKSCENCLSIEIHCDYKDFHRYLRSVVDLIV